MKPTHMTRLVVGGSQMVKPMISHDLQPKSSKHTRFAAQKFKTQRIVKEVLLKAENEEETYIELLKKHALTLRSKIHQMQLQIAEEMLKVQQIETGLEEIVSTTSYFLDRTQDILEIL